MDGSIGEQQMIVIRRASGFDHLGGERIGNRDVLELRSGRGEIQHVEAVLADGRFQRHAHPIFAVFADRAEQPGHHSRCFQFAMRAAQQFSTVRSTVRPTPRSTLAPPGALRVACAPAQEDNDDSGPGAFQTARADASRSRPCR